MDQLLDIFLHIDVHLAEAIVTIGPWIYLLLFLVVFCETGLVVTPFLPGDSLLFALGALTATGQTILSLPGLALLLSAAAIIGDAVNYAIGHKIGPKVFRYQDRWWLNKKHLEATQRFYERHGGKTIVIARFMPIIRTFAPFVAGIGTMAYRRFAVFNVTGALLWVLTFLFGGYFFGNIPAVKDHFELVILGIIFVSCLPLALRILKGWLDLRRTPADREAGA